MEWSQEILAGQIHEMIMEEVDALAGIKSELFIVTT